MNYISLNNLIRYHSKFKDYADAKYTLASDYGWKQTEKAGAVTCWPVGESRMKPVVEFLFKETLPASGEKGPDNPSTISGVSSVKMTRCGKNLLTKTPMGSTMPQRGITVTYNADGSIHLSGTASSSSLPYLRFFTVEPGIVPSILTAGTTLTVSLTCSDSNVYCVLYDSDSPTLWGNATIIYPGTPVTHTMSANVKTANLSMVVTRGAVINCDVYCQIEFVQSATAWETPADEDYSISIPSTFYGGTLDVATGKLTVTHRMVEADSLTLDISNYPAYLPLECTDTFGRTITSTGNILALTGSTGGKIVYKLANPYTVQIDPVAITALPQIDKYTPRLNTLYTDAENITVKYIKSPIRDEYEKVQAIIANGGTI